MPCSEFRRHDEPVDQRTLEIHSSSGRKSAKLKQYQLSHRQTLGYFMHPDFDALIEVIPSCIARGTVAEFAPIRAGEHIAEKIRASHEGKNNP